MKSDSLVELELVTEKMIPTHWHGFIELMYVISGTLEMTISENTWSLQPQDVIVINANRHHSYKGSGDLLLGRFMISESRIQDLTEQKTIVFWCNSAADQHETFGELRTILNLILNESLSSEMHGRVYRESLYYRLLHVLCSSFLIPQGNLNYEPGGATEEDRLQDIFAYIRSNCRQNIRLKDLADTLYLSETYVSRYIKKKCGVGFVELVNMVRLEQSMEDLVETNAPIIRIAMDNGFASVAAYNRYFKDRYKMSPSEYRKMLEEQRSVKRSAKDQRSGDGEVRRKLEIFLSDQPCREEQGSLSDREVQVDCLGEPAELSGEDLLSIINVGTMSDLLRYDLQEQILASRERLGFRYVRFWEPFGETMHVDIHAPVDQLNFGHVDMALDFLVRNGLRPYFELGYKPHRLLLNAEEAVYDGDLHRLDFLSDQEMESFHRRMIRHLIRRYGMTEVRKWYWEIHEQEELRVTKNSFDYVPLSDDQHEIYLHRFDVIASVLRGDVPGMQVGGGGFPPQHYGEAGMRHIAGLWSGGHLLPDFVSVTSFPYQIRREGRVYFESRSTDTEYLLHGIQLVKRAMAGTVLESRPLHVAEYGITLSNRNVINDSCYKAARLLHDLISCQGEKNVLLGHWLFSDLYADYEDTNRFLFGGAGLLSRDGIQKPSWYAFDFFRSAYSAVLFRDRNVLVTSDGIGAYRVLCHNLKNLTFSYYAKEENRITEEELPEMMEDRQVLKLHFCFEHLPWEEYLIRRKQVNSRYGSLQNEWKEMSRQQELTLEELQHLKKVTSYHLTMQNEMSSGGRVAFTVSLEPNEISWIQLSPC